MAKIYVASSWKNQHQPIVVRALRRAGHEVYDFKDEDGFHWNEIDENYLNWSVDDYIKCLDHEAAERGFNRDMSALRWAEACVYVMPCGVSASLEMGWACGQGKPTVIYIPELREPDLMVKMADLLTSDIDEVVEFFDETQPPTDIEKGV